MDDKQKPVVRAQAQTRLTSLLRNARVLLAGEWIEECFSGMLEPNAVSENVLECLFTVPNEGLPIEV
jgi:hypothetical protein